MVWEVSFSSLRVVLWYSILSFPVNTSGITSYFSKSYQNLWTLFLFCYFIVFMFIDLPFDLLHPFLPLPHTSLLATTNLFYFYWSIYLFFYISLSSYFFSNYWIYCIEHLLHAHHWSHLLGYLREPNREKCLSCGGDNWWV